MKEIIIREIKEFVAKENTHLTSTIDDMYRSQGLWQEPIVGFAAAESEYIGRLREIVHPRHQLPREVLPDAKTVIVYFVPFAKWVAESNISHGSVKISESASGRQAADVQNELASPQWAESYELTNSMFGRLNEHIINVIRGMGFEAATAPEAGVFYRDEVISHWSMRHLAYAAGLGTFGLNNMLITDKGCSGRCNALVTNLYIETGKPRQEEACLYKRKGECGLCMIKCPSGAITENGFDRHRCYEQCLKNAAIYTGFGSSYVSETETAGSEVCGKCIAGLPCAFRTPE